MTTEHTRIDGPARWCARVLLSGALILFAVLQAYGALPHRSDEGIYAYQAARVLAGAMPYRDFFHAHPPLHLLPTALVMALVGPSASVVDVIPAACAALQASIVFMFVAGAGAGLAWSAGALAGGCLLLSSPSFLRAAANDTGIMQASLALALGALLLARGRRIWAGLCLGAAPATLLQAAPAALVLVLSSMTCRERRLHSAAAAFALWSAVQLAAWALAGDAYLEQVYLYHLRKAGVSGEGMLSLRSVLAHDWSLFSAGALGAAIVLASGKRAMRIQAIVALALTAATFLVMATRPRVFRFYFQPAFFPAAVLAGLGVAQLVRALMRTASRSRKLGVLAASGACVLVVLAGDRLAAPALAPWHARELASLEREYTWVDAPRLGTAINAAVRATLWAGGLRTPERSPNRLADFLWQRSRWLSMHEQIVAAVVAEAATGRVTLFGDSSLVPRIALDAGVQVTGDVADTNVQRISSGSLAIARVIALLEAHPEARVLLGRRSGLGAVSELRRWVVSRCQHAGSFSARGSDTYDLYRQVSAAR